MKKPFSSHFLDDPSFRHWALQTDREAYAYWENWLQHHPERVEEAYAAAELIRALQEGEAGDTRAQSHLEPGWERIQRAIEARHMQSEEAAEPPVRPMPLYRRWLRPAVVAAAAMLLLAFGLIWLKPFGGETIVLAAGADSPQTYHLPEYALQPTL